MFLYASIYFKSLLEWPGLVGKREMITGTEIIVHALYRKKNPKQLTPPDPPPKEWVGLVPSAIRLCVNWDLVYLMPNPNSAALANSLYRLYNAGSHAFACSDGMLIGSQHKMITRKVGEVTLSTLDDCFGWLLMDSEWPAGFAWLMFNSLWEPFVGESCSCWTWSTAGHLVLCWISRCLVFRVTR